MKVNYITLSILLLILLISCYVITFHIRRNNLKTELDIYNNNLLKLLDENDIKEEFTNHSNLIEFTNSVKINNISVSDASDNEFKIDTLLIKGSNLNKIKGVFFGDVKGKILNNSNNQLFVLPPDLAKYTSIMSDEDFRNIEIKIHIEDNEYLDGLIKYNISELQDNASNKIDVDINFDINKEKSINILKTYEDSIRVQVNFEVVNESGIGNFKIYFYDNEENSYNYEFKKENQLISKTIYYDMKNKIDLEKMSIDQLKIHFESNDNEDLKFKITKLELKFVTDDISSLFPTGLFYRMDRVTLGNDLVKGNTKNWKIYIGERVKKDGINSFRKSKDLIKFYKDINTSLGIEEEKPQETKISYKVENLAIGVDRKDDTQIKVSWSIPDTVNSNKYRFFINFTPLNNNEEFKIVEEEIVSTKDTYMFSNKNLVIGNKYKIEVKTVNIDEFTQVLDTVEKEYVFKPLGMEDYHSHLLKDGKFDTTKLEIEDLENLEKTNPELLKTYIELLNYNKIKTQYDIGDLQLDIEEITQKTNEKLSNLKCGTIKKKKNLLINGLETHKENEQIDFVRKKDKQTEKMETIKKKINFLNELQGKKEDIVNLKIKTLKSLNDGTIINMEDLGKDRKLVLLNNGCLAFEKNKTVGKSGNFGYVKCNIFDPQQQFRIKKINNDIEFNNLMDLNLEEKITENSDYPFYILQPINSNKCVHIEDGNLRIENCKETENIKFQAYFSKSHCNV